MVVITVEVIGVLKFLRIAGVPLVKVGLLLGISELILDDMPHLVVNGHIVFVHHVCGDGDVVPRRALIGDAAGREGGTGRCGHQRVHDQNTHADALGAAEFFEEACRIPRQLLFEVQQILAVFLNRPVVAAFHGFHSVSARRIGVQHLVSDQDADAGLALDAVGHLMQGFILFSEPVNRCGGAEAGIGLVKALAVIGLLRINEEDARGKRAAVPLGDGNRPAAAVLQIAEGNIGGVFAEGDAGPGAFARYRVKGDDGRGIPGFFVPCHQHGTVRIFGVVKVGLALIELEPVQLLAGAQIADKDIGNGRVLRFKISTLTADQPAFGRVEHGVVFCEVVERIAGDAVECGHDGSGAVVPDAVAVEGDVAHRAEIIAAAGFLAGLVIAAEAAVPAVGINGLVARAVDGVGCAVIYR